MRRFSITALVLGLVLAGGSIQAQEMRNLLANGDFTQGTEGWSVGSGDTCKAEKRLWHELGIGAAPATVIHAVPGTEPEPQALRVLQASDGEASPLSLQVGAAHDDADLYLRLIMPLGGSWLAPNASERMRLLFDAHGEMTGYSVFICDSSGGTAEREPMWHNRGEGIKAAQGWQAKVTRGEAGWQADLIIPFAKLGFKPEPGRRTWRFGFRWKNLSGMLFWRQSLPARTRPQDCGWLAFD